MNGVNFDGVSDSALVEAKGPGYAKFVKDGEFQPWFTGDKALLEQAFHQYEAAKGAPVEWHVADPEVVPVLRNLFEKKGVIGIKVIHTPALK